MSSDLIDEFVSVSGVSQEEAMNWLEMGRFVLQDAIELFFSNNTSSSAGIMDRDQTFPALDNTIDTSDDVRLPDSVKRGRLIDDTFLITNKVAKVSSRSAFASGSNFKQLSAKEQTLAEIFKPPADLMTVDHFDGVLQSAKDSDQWLLVNLQRDSEFQCHTLNRDFWSDESVRDMVLCSFKFWQQQETAEDGKIYIDRYKVSDFPHISIIDPRTGASVWRHDGSFDKKSLAEKLQDFLGANPTPSTSHVSSRLMRKLTTGTSGAGQQRSRSNSQQTVHESSGNNGGGGENEEDDDLLQAIRMSLEHDHSQREPQQKHQSGSETNSTVALQTVAQEDIAVTPLPGFPVAEFAVSRKASPSLSIANDGNDALTATPAECPAITAADIKIMFKLSTGVGATKVLRTFRATASLPEVVEFAAQQLIAADASLYTGHARFEMLYNFPQVRLSQVSDFREQTLYSAGIQSGTMFAVNLLQ